MTGPGDEGGEEPGAEAVRVDGPHLRLVSWNIHGFRGLTDDQVGSVVEAIGSQGPDVVALQEVHHGSVSRLVDALQERDARLSHSFYTRPAEAKARHGELIASRWPVVARAGAWRKSYPFPEMAAHAEIQHPAVTFELIVVHVPNGSGNGWEVKTQALEALCQALREVPTGPRIVVGDFNEPKAFLADGTIETLTRQERQVKAVSFLLGEGSPHGLRHAWRSIDKRQVSPATWVHQGTWGTAERFFDHALVSADVGVIDAVYRHDWREEGRSDHSALVLDLHLSAADSPTPR